MLAEDANREIPLDALEMQYYRALIHESALSGHLRIEDTAHRYGFSCRDVSSAMSQDSVALHAATASRAFRSACKNEEAAIAIWQSFDDGSVISHPFAPSSISRAQIGDWALHTDEGFLYKVRDMRRSRLPKETGGVLIGTYDMQRKIVYVVDTLPAPPDSVENEKSFERGFCGLQERMEEIKQLTQDNLFYIGEWHSHPESYDSTYSEADRQLFQWLDEKIRDESTPPLMLIAGQSEYSWYIGKIESKATWKFDEYR
jgi:integrative and conjugative element protein (TIGR02256 family)